MIIYLIILMANYLLSDMNRFFTKKIFLINLSKLFSEDKKRKKNANL